VGGGPDRSGKKVIDFAGGTETARSVAIQSDGKIVIAGSQYNFSSHNFALARLDATGDLDTTFGDVVGGGPTRSGKKLLDFGGSDSAYDVAVQLDGRIIAAGTSNNNFAVARFLANGDADDTFGDLIGGGPSRTGRTTLDIDTNSYDTGRTLVVQPDGKIVVHSGRQRQQQHGGGATRYQW
jgi:uncharacterized delta-60 repeat protein